MFDLTAPGGCVVGSFPAWSPIKGPVRKVRYEWIGNCPIFNYTRQQLTDMFHQAGGGALEVFTPGRSGFLVRVWRPTADGGHGSTLGQGEPATD
jgi:hypothetical protein